LLAKGDHAFAHHNFAAAVAMPDSYLGFPGQVLRIYAGSAGRWHRLYRDVFGLSYFLGAEVAKRIGDAGTKAVLGVLVIVAIGLSIKVAVSEWRATRQERLTEQQAPKGSSRSGPSEPAG
jgi:hypothetical protein